MEKKAKLFPNPANEILNVEFEIAGAIKITIMDAQGKAIWKWEGTTNGQVQIPLKYISSSLYRLRAEMNCTSYSQLLEFL